MQRLMNVSDANTSNDDVEIKQEVVTISTNLVDSVSFIQYHTIMKPVKHTCDKMKCSCTEFFCSTN